MKLIQNMLNSKRLSVFILSTILLFTIITPGIVFARNAGNGQFIPCNGPDCDFGDFIELIQNVLNWVVMISFPAAVITFMWAGFILITSAGNASEKERAKKMLTKVVIGFAVILSAWLIVKVIVGALLQNGIGNQFIQF